MNYFTTKQTAKKWGISERRVRILCTQDKINGAKRMGWIWMVPANAGKPMEGRTLRHQKEKPTKRKVLKMTFDHIDEKKKVLDNKRPLPVNTVKSLRENMLIEWTYNSNAIEGNTLTISETKVVLEGITIGGKSMKEHLEVINHKDAILYLEELVEEKVILSEWDIKNIHRLVLKTIDDDNAGVYRTENVIISGAKHRPPQHYIVKEQIENLIKQYCVEWQALHSIERAALLHGEFVKIHPFVDGNGRTARLLLNFELMKAGFPPVIIKKEMRSLY
jgi:Fic family protein